MAFNRKYFDLFKNLLPKSNAFSIFVQKNLTKFFESLTGIPDDFRNFLEYTYRDLFPEFTRHLELWSNQFGLRRSSDDVVCRSNLDLSWKLKGGQSAFYIQQKLNDAGFDVQVHENNPQVDPDMFLNAFFVMTCGNTWAVCGNDDAFCGKTGGYVLANGFIPATSDTRDYLAVCGLGGNTGDTQICCGLSIACCGYFEQYLVYPKTFQVPDDSDYWGYIFFIGGNALRDPITHELTAIVSVDIPETRRIEFENLILKLKPVHSWAGMMITYS